MLLGGVALVIELTIRLLASETFGGRATAFDFGLKCDSPEPSCRNVAFEPEFNSFGHCIQGCLSILLFPGWMRLRRLPLLCLRSISCLVVIYPVYNVTKRVLL